MDELELIPLIVNTVKDPKTGEERQEYFFHRHGRWWRVVDPERRHPEEQRGIDLREDAAKPNFEPAAPEDSRWLDAKFFPSGWEKAWQEFEETSRSQIQILFILMTVASGVDPEHLRLAVQIHKELAEGSSFEEVWERHWKTILGILILGIGTGIVLTTAYKFFRLFARKRWLQDVTWKREGVDTLELEVKSEFHPDPDIGRGGLRADLRGQVEGETLAVDSSVFDWVNSTGQPGLARDLAAGWLEELEDFARRRGLERIEIDQIVSSPAGALTLRRMGFELVQETEAGGIGLWRRVIQLDE